jgi:hypothetical protein
VFFVATHIRIRGFAQHNMGGREDGKQLLPLSWAIGRSNKQIKTFCILSLSLIPLQLFIPKSKKASHIDLSPSHGASQVLRPMADDRDASSADAVAPTLIYRNMD